MAAMGGDGGMLGAMANRSPEEQKKEVEALRAVRATNTPLIYTTPHYTRYCTYAYEILFGIISMYLEALNFEVACSSEMCSLYRCSLVRTRRLPPMLGDTMGVLKIRGRLAVELTAAGGRPSQPGSLLGW